MCRVLFSGSLAVFISSRYTPTVNPNNHQPMKSLLALSRAIDALNERVGRAALWLVLAATLISAANAGMRYAFDMASNAWLELQW